MEFEFRTCNLEMDYEAFIKFLLRHYSELNLPYSFAMSLSFFSSPLLLGKALLIWSDEPYEVVGAAGYVYGTGPNDYEDQHVCQVEIAFIKEKYRNPSLFLHALQALLKEMKFGNPDVQQVQFWTAVENKELERLFSKFNALPGSTKSVVNNLVLYTVPFIELEKYSERLLKYVKNENYRYRTSETVR